MAQELVDDERWARIAPSAPLRPQELGWGSGTTCWHRPEELGFT